MKLELVIPDDLWEYVATTFLTWHRVQEDRRDTPAKAKARMEAIVAQWVQDQVNEAELTEAIQHAKETTPLTTLR